MPHTVKRMPKTIPNWRTFRKWIRGYLKQPGNFIFRGQSKASWPLISSLSRYLRLHNDRVQAHEWSGAERAIYQSFRDAVRQIWKDFEQWHESDVLALMQHYGCPTRLIDFTSDPWIAAFFALKDAVADSAIWVIKGKPRKLRRGFKKFPGPRFDPRKGKYFKIPKELRKDEATIIFAPTERLDIAFAAQHSCFLVPGHISSSLGDGDDNDLGEKFIHEKVVLGKRLLPGWDQKLKDQSGGTCTADMILPNIRHLAANAPKKGLRHKIPQGEWDREYLRMTGRRGNPGKPIKQMRR